MLDLELAGRLGGRLALQLLANHVAEVTPASTEHLGQVAIARQER